MIELLMLTTFLVYQDGAASQPATPNYDQQVAEAPEAPGVTEEALELFLLADKATRAVRTVSYDSFFEFTGSMAGFGTAECRAHVVMKFDEEGGRSVSISGLSNFIQDDGSHVYKMHLAINEDGARRVDYENGTLITDERIEGTAPSSAFGWLGTANIVEFGHPAPFSQDEPNAFEAKVEGQTFIDGVLCDVVWVDYGPSNNNAQARWYFGAEDHLPRRVARLRPQDGLPGALVRSLHNLKVNFEVDESLFALDHPEDFKLESIIAAGFND